MGPFCYLPAQGIPRLQIAMPLELSGPGKKAAEALLGSPQSLVGQRDGFGLPGWLPDQSLGMHEVEHSPVKPLPRSVAVMERQPQKRQDGVVDLVCRSPRSP